VGVVSRILCKPLCKGVIPFLFDALLDRLKPRYPWEVGKLKPLKAYTEDRFR